MTKVITLYDMYFSSFDDTINKSIPKRTVLELISCRCGYSRRYEFFSVIYWKVIINTEDGKFFSDFSIRYESGTPMEERRPFIYLEN